MKIIELRTEERAKERHERVMSTIFAEAEAISYYTLEETKRIDLERQRQYLNAIGEVHDFGNVEIF